MTMQQLMRALDIRGGNWAFRFEQPVYAKIKCEVSDFPKGEKKEVTEFISDSPESIIELSFFVAPWQVGEWSKPNQNNDKKMSVKLSNCNATNGTRLVWFTQKFSMQPWVGMKDKGQLGEYQPSIARYPSLNKEYILYYYYREGDPYEVKATICFVKSLEDAKNVEIVRKHSVRDFKNADE